MHSKPEIEIFSITEIFSKEWGIRYGAADVWAENYCGDQIAFSVGWHPDDFLINYNAEVNFYSPELIPYQADDIIKHQLLGQVEKILGEWWKEIIELREQINPKKWQMAAGVTVNDSYYALLAYLYEVRKPYSSRNITECLSNDMQCSIAAAKERIRKARDKGFLTSPGKGLVGQGEITNKAKKLLEKEGICLRK